MEIRASTIEEVAMSNPKDIRFRKKGHVVTVRIKVGGQWLDRSGGWRTVEEATAPAIALRNQLQAEYATAHPETNPENNVAGAEAKPGQRAKSLRRWAIEEHAAYCKRQRLREAKNGRSSLNWLWLQLGDKADLPPRLQKVQFFTKVRNALVDGPLAQSTVELYSKTIREILRRIPDLDEKCLAELENLPRKDGLLEASGDPFQRGHFKVMFGRIDSADETTQIVFWIGASGGPQIVDTVFLPFWAIDWTTGMVRYFRVKTGERIEFRALPPLLDLLKKRRDKLGPNAVYVLPELIFLKKHQKNPACNTKDWDGFKDWDKVKVPHAAAVRGAANGQKVMSNFLQECGIKTEDLTHKSFRKHNISFWASIGIKLKTRMRMAGHSKESSHHRYDVPAEFEIIRASEITWRYYQAIMKDEDFFIPTSTYDIYEVIMAHWTKLPELLQAILREPLNGLQGFLREAFGNQKSLIEEQTRILQAENAHLRELVSGQGKQLVAISARCDGLAKHFGIA
jgi:hypothetical protein